MTFTMSGFPSTSLMKSIMSSRNGLLTSKSKMKHCERVAKVTMLTVPNRQRSTPSQSQPRTLAFNKWLLHLSRVSVESTTIGCGRPCEGAEIEEVGELIFCACMSLHMRLFVSIVYVDSCNVRTVYACMCTTGRGHIYTGTYTR